MIKTATNTGSTERVIRTGLQAIIGSLLGSPLVVHYFNLSAGETAKIAALVSSVIVGSSWLQNFLEGRGWLPAILRQALAPATPAAAPYYGVPGIDPGIRPGINTYTPSTKIDEVHPQDPSHNHRPGLYDGPTPGPEAPETPQAVGGPIKDKELMIVGNPIVPFQSGGLVQ